MLVATGWSKLTHAGLGQGVDLPYVEQTGRDTSFVFQLEHICSNNDVVIMIFVTSKEHPAINKCCAKPGSILGRGLAVFISRMASLHRGKNSCNMQPCSFGWQLSGERLSRQEEQPHWRNILETTLFHLLLLVWFVQHVLAAKNMVQGQVGHSPTKMRPLRCMMKLGREYLKHRVSQLSQA